MRPIAVLALTAILATLAIHSQAEAACNEPDKSLAVVDFTTVVLGANKPSAIGVNGYYRMALQRKNCTIQATIAKLGFTNVFFARDKLQYGTFSTRTYSVTTAADPQPALVVDAELQSDSGTTLSVGFTFIGDSGFWRYLGASWDSAGMWGALQMVQARSLDQADYSAPKKLSCAAEVMREGSAVGAAFACGDFVLATAALDRALYFIPASSSGPEAPYFVKLAQSGSDAGRAWVEVCTDYEVDNGVDHSGALRLWVERGSVQTSEASTASARKCGRPRTPPPKSGGRWDGGIR